MNFYTSILLLASCAAFQISAMQFPSLEGGRFTVTPLVVKESDVFDGLEKVKTEFLGGILHHDTAKKVVADIRSLERQGNWNPEQKQAVLRFIEDNRGILLQRVRELLDSRSAVGRAEKEYTRETSIRNLLFLIEVAKETVFGKENVDSIKPFIADIENLRLAALAARRP